ncbi:MAG: DUF3488 and transglutaminase-like domain-containing protein [Planctomycetota bacterium]|nr:DUF3488 and transglutaminase-like domain-containing protein [Planctomycetota bacterium]
MNPSRGFSVCAFSVMALSVLAYALAEPMPAFFLVWLPLALAGWWFSRDGGRALPPLVTGLLIAAAVGFGAWRALESHLSVSTFSQFLAALLVIKTTERSSPRDYGLMLALSVFMCVGAILTSNALVVAVPVILALGLLVLSTMQLQVEAGHFAQRLRLIRLGMKPDATPPRMQLRLSASALVALVLGLSISAIVFVSFPRGLGAGQMSEWGSDLLSRRTGFTEVVRLGLGGNITQSQTAVLDVRFSDADGKPLGGYAQQWYLRGAALDEYTDGSWRRSPRQIEDDALPEGATVNVLESSRRPVQLQQSTTLRSASRNSPVFVAWQPVRVRSGHSSDRLTLTPETLTIRREGGSGVIAYDADLTLPRQNPEVEYERFGASFDSAVVHRHAIAALKAAEMEPDPEKRAVHDDARAARAIESYLSRNFAYTLNAGAAPTGTDPIEWFLDTRKAGHCEYFASAMVAMCRSVGMDARVIAGYVASEWNEASNSYVVRESNAHAWAEVEIGGGYWATFDPSPQEELRATQQGSNTLSAWIGRLLDDVNYAWNREVVSFDESRRVALLGPDVASPLSGNAVIRWLAQRFRPNADESRGTALARGLMLFFAVIALGAAMVLAGRWLARLAGWTQRLGFGTRTTRVVDPWHAGLLRALARRGLTKPAWRPLAMHVEHSPLSDTDRTLARRVAWASYRTRFGFGLDTTARDQAADALRRLERRT